jgi:hypothetical protein
MGYQAQQGVPLTLFHPVRDINENYVAGQAAAVTKQLLGPDRLVDAVSPVVLVDYAVAGWVAVTLTLPLLGQYTLHLTNPADPVADGRTTPYDVFVGTGVAVGTGLLTSLDRVRARMMLKKPNSNPEVPIQPGESHPFDALINLLISEVSDAYQGRLGRTFAEADYVEYLDGTGRGSLVLGNGPLVSFSSLNWVDYQDDGAGGVTEVLTVVPRSSYVLAGLRSQTRYYGLGRVDLLGGGLFTPGPRRYKAAYRAGFSPLPEGLVGLATEDIVYRLMTRETGHLLSQSLGDGTISYMRPQQMDEARETVLSTYILAAA